METFPPHVFELNDSLIGDFGEYIYQKYAQSMGFKTNRVNMGEIDIFLQKDLQKYEVDVKTTRNISQGYKGQRSKERKAIIYEQVVVKPDYILINFDERSPFFYLKSVKIENTEKNYYDWKKDKDKPIKRINKFQKIRDEIKQNLIHILSDSDFRFRYIFRGSVSLTRWSSQPDSLPGSKKVITKFDYTIFVQMKYSETNLEELSEIFVFEHSQYNKKIKLITSSVRQQKKGLMQVIDKEDFRKNNPELIFSDINSFKAYADKKLKKIDMSWA